jgi:hypothetical protein
MCVLYLSKVVKRKQNISNSIGDQMNKNILIGTFSIALLMLLSCSLEEPALPTWLAEWRIPFESSYAMREILEDENFVIDTTETGQQLLAIHVSDSTEERTVSISDLSIQPDNDYFGDIIDDLSLGTIGPISSNPITLENILGFPPQSGQTVNVAEATVDIDLIYLLYIDVDWANVKEGLLRLQFMNQTFLDIQGGLEIDIYNDSTHVLLGTATVPDPIPAMGSGLVVPDIDLSEKTIQTRFLLKIRMPLSATSRQLVDDDLDDIAWIDGTLIDVTVNEAKAVFPPQHLEIRDSTSIMEEEHRIRTAEIATGSINLLMENQLDASANILVRLFNFTDESGEILTKTVQLEGKSITNQTIRLEDYFITDYPNPNSGNYIDYIQYEVSLVTDSTGAFSTLSVNDSVSVHVYPDSIFFSQIEGRINAVEIDIDPVEKTNLEGLSRIDGKIYLDSLEMILDIYNGVGVPVSLTLTISASDDDQEIVLAPVIINVPASGSSTFRLSGKDAHPNIIDLVSILPNRILFEATALVDGDGRVETGQTVWARFQIHSPLFLRIAAQSFLLSDISEEKLDTDVRENIEKNIKNARIFFDVFNGLPVGSSASIYVATDSTDLYSEQIPDSSSKFIISGIDVPAANVGLDGYVLTPVSNQIEVNLTQQQLDLFSQNEIVYFGTKTFLDETNGLVKFRLRDKISTNGYFRFEFLMNND